MSQIKIKNANNLLYLLMSNGEIWSSPHLKNNSIVEKDGSITCAIHKLSTQNDEHFDLQDSYLIQLTGGYEFLSPIRIKLLEFISSQNFSNIYVVKDDSSNKIACELFPLINEIETLLRGYLMQFFITKLGVKWWDITADNEMKQKIIKRKNNERIFSKYIDNKVYLIDFNELGKMAYSMSSGYINKDDILNKIVNIADDDIEAVRILKKEVQTNYNKYFKELFQDKNFQKKWEDIEKIRHKVAHNNLFTQEDLDMGKKICSELKSIIGEATRAMDKLNFTEKEKENIAEVSLSNSSDLYKDFVDSWRILENDLRSTALKNGLLKDNKTPLPPSSLIRKLRENEIISTDMYENVKMLIAFRNSFFHSHTANAYSQEKVLPDMIRDILKVITALGRK